MKPRDWKILALVMLFVAGVSYASDRSLSKAIRLSFLGGAGYFAGRAIREFTEP